MDERAAAKALVDKIGREQHGGLQGTYKAHPPDSRFAALIGAFHLAYRNNATGGHAAYASVTTLKRPALIALVNAL